MDIAPNGHSAKQEKKVANKLYKSIIIMVIVTALGLIAYGALNKDIRTRVLSPLKNPSAPAYYDPSGK